jgi:DNA-binding MarR family transcriptional regulator
MVSKLQAEIRQQRPFRSREAEALLNVLRTADALTQRLAEALKPFGLTPSQYNVLRILRGAGAEGSRCGEIAERLVAHDPDVTRLLDRLERSGLVTRARDAEDRRVVRTTITARGLAVLKVADGPVDAVATTHFGSLGSRAIGELIAALEAVRAARQDH